MRDYQINNGSPEGEAINENQVVRFTQVSTLSYAELKTQIRKLTAQVDRIQVIENRIILPNGKEIALPEGKIDDIKSLIQGKIEQLDRYKAQLERENINDSPGVMEEFVEFLKDCLSFLRHLYYCEKYFPSAELSEIDQELSAEIERANEPMNLSGLEVVEEEEFAAQADERPEGQYQDRAPKLYLAAEERSPSFVISSYANTKDKQRESSQDSNRSFHSR